MKIRTALTLKIMYVTAAVLLLCMVLIYIVSAHMRSVGFFHDLKSEAVTKAHLFLKGKADAATMQSIYRNNSEFINEVEVAVYTPDFRMLYHDAVQSDMIKEDSVMISDILQKGEVEFYIGKYQCIGMLYPLDGKNYVITAAAYDGYGYGNLAGLGRTLLILFIVGVSLLSVTGYLLARASLMPVRNIVREVGKITASKINRRLTVKNDNDELDELSVAFNALLERLEKSFTSQKMFVSNVSHELRTPLAALVAELDIALKRSSSEEEYRSAIRNALSDAAGMATLIDGLLNLAKADYGKEQIRMQEIRLDELLLDTREHMLRGHPDYKIELLFENEDTDDDRLITVSGNRYLLETAFTNLVENNCKYSPDKTASVRISHNGSLAVVRCSDNGEGMTDEEKRHLFTLFYRGEHGTHIEGHGIGLALARKIIALHQGNIEVVSEKERGTTFTVQLPHL